MKIRQLYTFKIVCEEESITRAAEHLSTTQPAISRTISELEETLGTQLFDRTSRKIVLNEAGQLFVSKVIPLLELYEDLEKGLPDSDVRYQLRIGATPSLAGTLLFQILEKFRLKVHDGNSDHLLSAFIPCCGFRCLGGLRTGLCSR